MQRYSTKQDKDLRLGVPCCTATESCSAGATIRESVAVLDERLQHVGRSVCELTDRANVSGRQLADVSGRLGAVETGLNALGTQIGTVETRVGRLETQLVGVDSRLSVVEERLSHTATKTWVLGCAIALLLATLSGTLGGVWWIIQQYVGPLLRASGS
jgi:hypothetical protein